jgi:hypothetical protein
MASVVTIIIEPNCLNSSVGIVTVFHNFYPCSKTVGIVTVFLHVRVQGFFQGFFRTVKRPQKLNLELSFETQSSHQKIQCSKNEVV